MQPLRYYIFNSTLPVDEDAYNEFKGHRNIVTGEVPPRAQLKRSRGPISRTINAFLNTGLGGTIYCGVTDGGEVKGLNFSLYQMDHLRVSIQDTLSQYKPTVPPHRWNLEFVPVLPEKPSADELEKIYQLSQKYDPKLRERHHIVGTHKYCWCDKDSMAVLNLGIIHPDYVAEIIVNPWEASNPLDAAMVQTRTKIHPVHEAEDGRVYMRSNASVTSLTMHEVIERTKLQVKSYYANK